MAWQMAPTWDCAHQKVTATQGPRMVVISKGVVTTSNSPGDKNRGGMHGVAVEMAARSGNGQWFLIDGGSNHPHGHIDPDQ